MTIQRHPKIGTVLICNFEPGFQAPEMVKRRLVVVVSPRISVRPDLCVVVPLSTTAPHVHLPFHCRLKLNPPPPEPWGDVERWVKGDMLQTVGFHRLELARFPKGMDGSRSYYNHVIDDAQLTKIRACILNGLGLGNLTKHLFQTMFSLSAALRFLQWDPSATFKTLPRAAVRRAIASPARRRRVQGRTFRGPAFAFGAIALVLTQAAKSVFSRPSPTDSRAPP